MVLKGKFKVMGIKKKTSAVFFKDLKVGDEFELVYDLNGSYGEAPFIHIYSNGKRVHGNNALQLKQNLEKFEIEQIG
jgi:hypothetical protein